MTIWSDPVDAHKKQDEQGTSKNGKGSIHNKIHINST